MSGLGDFTDLSWAADVHLEDEAATQAFGAALAPRFKAGDVVYLIGELGAGKSALARAIIQALDPEIEAVPSPTFTLIQHYETPGPDVAHLDLYRLKSPDEVWELGLEELTDCALILIEWPERLGPVARQLGFDRRLEISLKEVGETARTISLKPLGGFGS